MLTATLQGRQGVAGQGEARHGRAGQAGHDDADLLSPTLRLRGAPLLACPLEAIVVPNGNYEERTDK